MTSYSSYDLKFYRDYIKACHTKHYPSRAVVPETAVCAPSASLCAAECTGTAGAQSSAATSCR